jgi:hypothetical protein
MSILVNGSPTEEINIQCGLKQGDPLAPFLFLLVAEGLGGFMRKAVDLHRFHGFHVGRGGVVISHLQYADDTLCIGEATVENLWCLKAILRGFELVSGLKVNFWKSSILGVNVSDNFMCLASVFLNCRIGGVPFKYLGLPVGASIRREATWEPLVASLRKRLGGWENRFISLGGRITLLNSVLNAIPIFYLSYIKIPRGVWKKTRRLQRKFLWGGRGGRKKLSWVKWDAVCQPKRLGGLGVKDIRAVNISLLAKWRWRLLNDDKALWKEVIRSKYGDSVIGRVEWGEGSKLWFSSSWWRDICSIGTNLDHNWFAQQAVKKMGNGEQTSFWKEVWVCNLPLCTRFPRLFSVSQQQEASVASLKNQSGGWNFVWRRRLFVWETELLDELTILLDTVVLSTTADSWGWRPEEGGEFTVKSTYNTVVSNFIAISQVSLEQQIGFKAIWKCKAPTKVSGFVWTVLLDRVPTRANLFRRQILSETEDRRCVFCGDQVETTTHLFLYCRVTIQVWQQIFRWLGSYLSLPHSIWSMLSSLTIAHGSKQYRSGLVMIWSTVIWTIWRHRNRIIFYNGQLDGASMIDEVKVSSWKRWISRFNYPPCLFYEWIAEPEYCLKKG